MSEEEYTEKPNIESKIFKFFVVNKYYFFFKK